MCGPGQSSEQQLPQKAVQSGGLHPKANGPQAADNWEAELRYVRHTTGLDKKTVLDKNTEYRQKSKRELAEWLQSIIIRQSSLATHR